MDIRCPKCRSQNLELIELVTRYRAISPGPEGGLILEAPEGDESSDDKGLRCRDCGESFPEPEGFWDLVEDC